MPARWTILTLCLLALVVQAILPRRLSAQDELPAASSPWAGRPAWRTGHAWFAASIGQDPEGKPFYALMHIPPRDAEGLSTAGTIRRAARLASMPEALAGWGNDVWLVFRSEISEGKSRRRISRLAVSPTGFGGEFQVSGGLQTGPSLPLSGTLLASAGTPVGPLVLLRDDENILQMMVLCQSGWRPLRLPDNLESATGRFGAAATRDGPLIGWVSGDRCEWAIGSLKESSAGLSVDWSRAQTPAGSLSMQDPGPEPRLSLPQQRAGLHWSDGQMIWTVRSEGEATDFFSIRVGSVTPLVSMTLRQPSGVVAIDGLGRLACVSEDVSEPPPAGATQPTALQGARVIKFKLNEFSAYAGGTLHSGTGVAGLFAPWQLQVLTMTLSVLILGVLLFVLRTESDAPLPLPDGLALAPPLRRLAAALLDVAFPCLIASLIHGIHPLEILSIPFSARAALDWVPLATVLFLVLTASTLAEWRTGRTIGKRFLGLGVVGFAPTSETPTRRQGSAVGHVFVGTPSLWQAVLRNAFRWIAWPLTILLLLDANRRHPGDVLANTLVVCRADDTRPD